MAWLKLTAVKLCVGFRISGDEPFGSATRVSGPLLHSKSFWILFQGSFLSPQKEVEQYNIHYISKFTLTKYIIELHINFRCQDNTHIVLCKSSGLFSVTSFARWYKQVFSYSFISLSGSGLFQSAGGSNLFCHTSFLQWPSNRFNRRSSSLCITSF